MVNFHTNCCRTIREVVELAAKGEVSVFRRGHSDSRYVNIERTEDYGELKPAVDMAVTVKVEGEAAELAALGSARTRTSKVFNSNHHLTHFGRAQAILRSGTIAGKAWKHQVMLYSNKVMRIPFLPARGYIILLQG